MRRLILTMAFVAGCGSGTTQPPANSQYVAGFDPGAVPSGYERFISPPVTGLVPGTNEEYCQWVKLASDQDFDVLAFQGAQSKGGHHAVLYASTRTHFPVGESHVCTEDDMVSFSFLGAIGGEGMATNITGLPDGLIFRLRKGNALVINSHYINASPQTIEGQAVMDVKFAAPSSDHQVADLFANNGAGFSVPPGKSASWDANCVVQKDLSFAMVTNHMHGYGISAMSEIIHADGTHEVTVKDDVWLPEQKFNPRYARFGVTGAKVAKKGDTYHTRCAWTNTTANALGFPTEMCAGVGFYFPGNGTVTCSDGSWSGN